MGTPLGTGVEAEPRGSCPRRKWLCRRKFHGRQRFGYDFNQTATFNTKFRNPVLSTFSAERLQIIYAAQGIDGVAGEIEKLKRAGMI